LFANAALPPILALVPAIFVVLIGVMVPWPVAAEQLATCSTIALGPSSGQYSIDPIRLDPQRRRLYVAGRTAGALSVVDLDGKVPVQRWAIGAEIGAVTVDSVDGTLYLSEGTRSAPHVILVLDGRTGAQLRAISAPYRVSTIALDRKLGLLIATASVPDVPVGIPHVLTYSWPSIDLLDDQFVGINASVSIAAIGVDERLHEVYARLSVRAQHQIVVYDVRDFSRPRRVVANSGTGATRENRYPIMGVALDSSRDRVVYSLGYPPARSPVVRAVPASLPWKWDDDTDARRIPLDRPGAVAVDARTGIVYVASAVYSQDVFGGAPSPTGTLWAVQFDSEQVLATVPLGRGPHDVAVDPTDSAVYVTNQADGTLTRIAGLRLPDDERAAPCWRP
jgi:hypothetical protein